MFRIISDIVFAIATALIIVIGIYFTFYYKFRQFKFKTMFKYLFEKEDSKGISSLESLIMTLGCRIGVGSIAGVALAIHIGGVGSIFWLWLTAFIGSIITFVETGLGIIYKERDEDNIYKGGPAYYIKKGLGLKQLGALYAILVIICYSGGFIGIQANTITKSLLLFCPTQPYIIGIVIAVSSFFVIKGGIKNISKVMNKLVPLMGIFYLGVALFLSIVNITEIPSMFYNIMSSAFNCKSVIGGMIPTMIVGMQRGFFSNEAGLGTGSITSSCSSTNNSVKQGYIQMLGIYITTIFICTATVIIILTSNYNYIEFGNINGIEIVQYAFKYHFGVIGEYLLFISILFFSFSTILTGYYNGESCLKYFFTKVSIKILTIFRIISCSLLFVCSIISPTVMWNIVDFLVAILMIINIFSIYKLRDKMYI